MRKSFRHGIAAALILMILIGVAWLRLRGPADPVYQGKRLSVWLKGYDPVPTATFPSGGRMDVGAWQGAMEAVRHVGTNAIPRLMWMLQRHDSPLKTKLLDLVAKQRFLKIKFTRSESLNSEAASGLQALGTNARVVIPELIKIYDRERSSNSRQMICSLFYHFASDASAAVPSLVRRLASKDVEGGVVYSLTPRVPSSVLRLAGKDEAERNGVINALRRIRAAPIMVVPALIDALHDPMAENRRDAAYALAVFGTNATEAIGPLNELLNDPVRRTNSMMSYDVDIPSAVRFALEHIEPKPAAQIGVR